MAALAAALMMSAVPASAITVQDGVERTPTRVVPPDYPRGAERRNIEGTVTITYAISADGEVEDAVVTSADPEGVFDRSALAAVNRWRFEPHAERTEGHVQELRFQLQ